VPIWRIRVAHMEDVWGCMGDVWGIVVSWYGG
jgi:hypothetical protein